MTFKESLDNLIRQNLVKKCPRDSAAISRLISRAKKDIVTAKRNLTADEDCAFNYAYNAMLHSGLALMFSEGFRPEIKGKHLTIVKFSGAILGEDGEVLVSVYDYMRKKRHQFIYEPGAPCSQKEAKDAIKSAEEFLAKTIGIIKLKNPQQEFNF